MNILSINGTFSANEICNECILCVVRVCYAPKIKISIFILLNYVDIAIKICVYFEISNFSLACYANLINILSCIVLKGANAAICQSNREMLVSLRHLHY